MLAITFSIAMLLLLVLAHTVDGWYSPGADNFCLFCDNAREPHACTHFVEIWPNEVCTTERIMLLNGTTVWNFGYEDRIYCTGSDFIHNSRALARTRARSNQPSGFVLCHECCYTDMCNHKLCGSTSYNDLVCLKGDGDRELPPVLSHVAYCNQNESCYVSKTDNSRPGQFNYGCASKVICRELPATDYHGTCQRCCTTDGCNAHACNLEHTGPVSSTANTASQTSSTGPDYSSIKPTSRTTSTQLPLFTDCSDLHNQGGMNESGKYEIRPVGGSATLVQVWCDMETDGGGWTVLQRRFDGSVNFTRDMSEYEGGFGDVSGEYWLGLDWMHLLTSQGEVQLRVDLCAFDGQAGYAVYDGFSIAGPNETYRLHTGTYAGGSITDELTWQHNGRTFQTTGTCADKFRGGWWYEACYLANLNGGMYNASDGQGIAWYAFDRDRNNDYNDISMYPSLRSSEMKIRPAHEVGDTSRPYTCPV